MTPDASTSFPKSAIDTKLNYRQDKGKGKWKTTSRINYEDVEKPEDASDEEGEEDDEDDPEEAGAIAVDEDDDEDEDEEEDSDDGEVEEFMDAYFTGQRSRNRPKK